MRTLIKGRSTNQESSIAYFRYWGHHKVYRSNPLYVLNLLMKFEHSVLTLCTGIALIGKTNYQHTQQIKQFKRRAKNPRHRVGQITWSWAWYLFMDRLCTFIPLFYVHALLFNKMGKILHPPPTLQSFIRGSYVTSDLISKITRANQCSTSKKWNDKSFPQMIRNTYRSTNE